VTSAEAQRYADRCADALDTIAASAASWPERPQLERDSAGVLPRGNLSVKVSALTPLLRPDAPERGQRDAAERLRPLLRRANERGAHLHIDMESMDSREAVLELILALLAEDEVRAGPPRPHLLPRGRPRGRDGVPHAPAAREHVQRVVPLRAGARRAARGVARAAGRYGGPPMSLSPFKNEPILELRRAPVRAQLH